MDEELSRRANNQEEAFFPSAAVFLPYLNPIELALFSSTCNTMYRLAKLVTARRISDASGTWEKVPIPFLNHIPNDRQLYSYFLYSPTQVLPVNPDFRQAWGSEMCNPALGPGLAIPGGGLSFRLNIVKNHGKDWCLCAGELIPKGKFICEYTGELLTIQEYDRRVLSYDLPKSNACATPALLVVKEHFPFADALLKTIIDATRVGSIGRFINHSCSGGNLEARILRAVGTLLPRVCLFTSTEIQEGEELSFSYGSCHKILLSNAIPCCCYSPNCAGVLPSKHPCIEVGIKDAMLISSQATMIWRNVMFEVEDRTVTLHWVYGIKFKYILLVVIRLFA